MKIGKVRRINRNLRKLASMSTPSRSGEKLSRREKKLKVKREARNFILTRSRRIIALKNGDMVSLLRWAERFERSCRLVGNTRVRDMNVSTVFLGVNHQFYPGKPKVFETMIFGGNADEPQWRYSTYKEAVKGHATAVKHAEGLPHLVSSK